MEVKISGSGRIGGGVYESVGISGSGKISGDVQCENFHCSGSARCDGALQCSDTLHISGSLHAEKDVSATELHISGSLKGQNLFIKDSGSISGTCELRQDLKCETISVSGSLHTGGGIEATDFRLSGALQCDGLLNAENVDIRLGALHNEIGAVGGSRIRVTTAESHGLFRRMLSPNIGPLKVREAIEGDEIHLENTVCPLVSGRSVKIGKGCDVGTVRYSEELETADNAAIGSIEKIGL